MKKILLFFIACIGMIACSSDDDLHGQNMEYQTLAKGNNLNQYNDLDHNLNLVISSLIDFENFVTQVGYDITDFPEINYNESTIIVVLGKLNTIGSNYEVLNIVEYSEFIKVNTKESTYDSTVMSKPFHIVKINKTNKSIFFN